MAENLHSSLPIEYQLNYGTACRDLNVSQFMNKSTINGIAGAEGCLSQEELFRILGIEPGSLLVDRPDALLVGPNRF